MRVSRRTGLLIGFAPASLLGGCGGSGGSGLSASQRVQTGTVCVDVAGAVSTAAQVGLKLANGSLSQAAATAQLAPIQKHVSDLAAQNSALPAAASLTALAASITKIEGVSPSAAADLQTAGTQITTATKDLLSACAAVRH